MEEPQEPAEQTTAEEEGEEAVEQAAVEPDDEQTVVDEPDDEQATEDYEDLEEGEEECHEQRPEPRRRPCCKTARIDELATPNKRTFLALWNEHAYHLPKDKIKHLKELLQQLYAMTPEETAKYFAELRGQARCAAIRKRMKQKLRKFLQEKHQQRQRDKAFKLFYKLLKCGISYAAYNRVPPLVSIRLRYLSDIILDQLCCLRRLEVPSRSNPDQLGSFLISVADWMAIAVEHLYFAAQMTINELTEEEYGPDETIDSFGHPKVPNNYKNMTQTSFDRQQAPASFRDLGAPVGTSTPRNMSLQQTQMSFNRDLTAKNYSELKSPVQASTPKALSLQQVDTSSFNPPSYSTPRKLPSDHGTQMSIDETTYYDTNQTLDPFYSYVAEKSVLAKAPKRTNRVPMYRLEQMTSSKDKPLSMFPDAKIGKQKYGERPTLPLRSQKASKTFRELEKSILDKSSARKKSQTSQIKKGKIA